MTQEQVEEDLVFREKCIKIKMHLDIADVLIDELNTEYMLPNSLIMSLGIASNEVTIRSDTH